MRESIAAVDDLLATAEDGGHLGINAADLILLLQGKVYPDFACNSVTGSIPRSSLASIRHAVRSRVLELTLELEKAVPDAAAVAIGPAALPSAPSAAAATQIAQQIIYGNFTSIAATGDGATIQVAVAPHDARSLAQFLTGSGMAEEDAQELARLAASEKPESNEEPMVLKCATGSSRISRRLRLALGKWELQSPRMWSKKRYSSTTVSSSRGHEK